MEIFCAVPEWNNIVHIIDQRRAKSTVASRVTLEHKIQVTFEFNTLGFSICTTEVAPCVAVLEISKNMIVAKTQLYFRTFKL